MTPSVAGATGLAASIRTAASMRSAGSPISPTGWAATGACRPMRAMTGWSATPRTARSSAPSARATSFRAAPVCGSSSISAAAGRASRSLPEPRRSRRPPSPAVCLGEQLGVLGAARCSAPRPAGRRPDSGRARRAAGPPSSGRARIGHLVSPRPAQTRTGFDFAPRLMVRSAMRLLLSSRPPRLSRGRSCPPLPRGAAR